LWRRAARISTPIREIESTWKKVHDMPNVAACLRVPSWYD
jgi:hypothetical protein